MSAASVLPPRTTSQSSRKGKKAWRKNIDLAPVEEGLDELRQQTIESGAPLSSKTADELFVVDSVGDKHQLVAHQSRLNLSKKAAKADEIIYRRSAVPAVDSRKRRPAASGLLPDSKRARPAVSRSHLERLREIAYSGGQGPKHTFGDASDLVARAAADELDDPWAAPPPTRAALTAAQRGRIEKLTFVRAAAPAKAPASLAQPAEPLTASGKRIAAVPRPDAGRSYNPAFDDWERLVAREGEKAVVAEQDRLEAEQTAAEEQARVRASAAEADAKERELDLYGDESEWEGFATEPEDEAGAGSATLYRLKQRKVKTKTERNRIGRRKEAERLVKHEERMRESQAKKAGPAALVPDSGSEPEGDGGDGESDGESVLSEEGHDEELRRRTFGPAVVPGKRLEVLLEDELEDSLRRLKPQGNSILDRYRSFLVRGKVEARRRHQHKKARRKATEKWTYKDFKI